MLNHLPQPIQHPIDIKHLSLIHSNFLIYSRSISQPQILSIIYVMQHLHITLFVLALSYLFYLTNPWSPLHSAPPLSTSSIKTLYSLLFLQLLYVFSFVCIVLHCSSRYLPVLSFTIVYSGKLIVICVELLQLVEVHALYLLVHLFIIVSLLFMSYLDSSI